MLDTKPDWRRYLDLIVFEHSVFALPFTLAGLVFAEREGAIANKLTPGYFLIALIVVCAVSARTAAMAFNRVIDLRFDRENVRTAGRELVTGAVSARAAWTMVLASSLIFLLGAWSLGDHCLMLAPFVLGYLFFYSYSKRFTSFSHLVLGWALALAPGGAWWVLRPRIEIPPLLLMGAVAFWVAGFDILYSTQDEAFDKKMGLFSLPRKLGTARALLAARYIHGVALVLLALVGLSLRLPALYFAGLLPIGAMFVYQHRLVRPNDLSRLNRAFFTVNGWISAYYLVLAFVSTSRFIA